MQTGMDWDLHTYTITVAKIQEGMQYYQKQYGTESNICFYSKKSTLPELPKYLSDKITMVATEKVSEGHLYFGVKTGTPKI